MKKKQKTFGQKVLDLAIVLTVISLITCLVCTNVTPAYAAPGDVVISFTIPAAKVADFSAGFLAECPIPQIPDPCDPNNNLVMIDKFTPKQWLRVWIIRHVMRAYGFGKELLKKQTAIIDPNVIEE